MSTVTLVILLVIIFGGSFAVLYLFLGPLFTGRFKRPSERRREHRHKPLN